MQAISMRCSDQGELDEVAFSLMGQGVENTKGSLPDDGFSAPFFSMIQMVCEVVQAVTGCNAPKAGRVT